MIELQLVGYTADLKYLVFSDLGDGSLRYKVPVDDDLVATLGEVAESGGGFAVPTPPQPPEPPGTRPGEGVLAALAVLGRNGSGAEAVEVVPVPEVATAPVRSSKLSPRAIQALLRAGKPLRSVAKQAETDEAWVQRWLPPIEAEREQVLAGVRAARVAKSRLGPSGDLLGEAVRRNLSAKGVDPDGPDVVWTAARREGDAHWTVTLQYRNRGRSQRATWRFDPETGGLDARGQSAVDLAWTRPVTAPTAAARKAAKGGTAAARRAKSPRR